MIKEYEKKNGRKLEKNLNNYFSKIELLGESLIRHEPSDKNFIFGSSKKRIITLFPDLEVKYQIFLIIYVNLYFNILM